MAATRTTLHLGLLFLCFHFGLMITQTVLDPSKITVDCSKVTSPGKLKGMSITLQQEYKPVFVNGNCTFGDSADTAPVTTRKIYTVTTCSNEKMLLIVVNKDFDASSRILTRNASEFTVSCIDGETNIATASLQSATIPTIEVHPKVSLKLLDSPPSKTNVGVQGNPDAKYSYGRDLYLTFVHENANSGGQLVLIPLDCSAKGHTHPAVTLFNTNDSTNCVQQTSVLMNVESSGKTVFKVQLGTATTNTVTYAKFKAFSFVEPSPTVTISCTVRVCDNSATSIDGGKCKEDYEKMNACKDTVSRKRRDVNRVTKMTGGQEHGQVHRVSTSYSIQENLRATGGSNMISRTFSLLLASFLILFL